MYIDANKSAQNLNKGKSGIMTIAAVVLGVIVIICIVWIKRQSSRLTELNDRVVTAEQTSKQSKEQMEKAQKELETVKNDLTLTIENQKKIVGDKEEEINKLKDQVKKLTAQSQAVRHSDGTGTGPAGVPRKPTIPGEQAIVFDKTIPVNKQYIDSVLFKQVSGGKVAIYLKLVNKTAQDLNGYQYVIHLYDKDRKNIGSDVSDDSSAVSFFNRANILQPGKGTVKTFNVSVSKAPAYFVVSVANLKK